MYRLVPILLWKSFRPSCTYTPKCTFPQCHASTHLKEDLRAQCGYLDRASSLVQLCAKECAMVRNSLPKESSTRWIYALLLMSCNKNQKQTNKQTKNPCIFNTKGRELLLFYLLSLNKIEVLKFALIYVRVFIPGWQNTSFVTVSYNQYYRNNLRSFSNLTTLGNQIIVFGSWAKATLEVKDTSW